MGWLKRRVMNTIDRSDRVRPVNGEDRQVFLTLATSLMGRDTTAGSSFDDDVRAAIMTASGGAEAVGLEQLASTVHAHLVPISIPELSTFGRAARAFGVDDDKWTFVGACVQR